MLAYDLIITLAVAIATVLFAIALVKILKQYKYSRLILLGELK